MINFVLANLIIMKYIKGSDREQVFLFPVSLEQTIDTDNDIRLVDLFVDGLKLADYGFKVDFVENGRPAYHPGDLLKLFIYGYMNKTRSSRDLEKECKRNIEVIWLMKGLQPDHNTISNFRRDNPEAIKKVFRSTVQIARNFNLIGGKLIAGDGTKIRAQNSKKNNFNHTKVERHINYIDKKLEEFNKELAEQDNDSKQKIEQKIEQQKERRKKYKEIQSRLNETDASQISTTDPESRMMICSNNAAEVTYNIQASVDSEHKLPIDFKVTNIFDLNALGNMIRRAKSILNSSNFTALYDKGFHAGSELKIAQCLGVETMVAFPKLASSSTAPNPKYNLENFVYNQKENSYLCPRGHVLTTNGKWYKKTSHTTPTMAQRYTTPQCKTCPALKECTSNWKRARGRVVERTEFASYIEQNHKNIVAKKDIYKRRQEIVEHPFGTIKRQWGFNYIITKKGIRRANADVGFMFIAYNLRRIINIIGKDALREYLQTLCFHFFCVFFKIRAKTSSF
jgi:transposase